MDGGAKLTLNYLIIGNITKDLLPDGSYTIGGTVTYASRAALALGCRVAAVTSFDATLTLGAALEGVQIIHKPAPATLTFENVYTPEGRTQFLHAVAAPLGLEDVPPHWRHPDIVHLGPLAGECDPSLVQAFPDALVGVTPQGWMRTWNGNGQVEVSQWTDAEQWLPHVDAAILSIQDVGGDETTIARFAALAPILVVTLGPAGCRVYAQGEVRHIPVAPRPEVDPTGAGDIFAAAYLVRLRQSGDPWEAARLANQVAALSVGRVGWAGAPTPAEIKRFWPSE